MELNKSIEQIYTLERKLRLGRNVESGLEIVDILESFIPAVLSKEANAKKEYQLILEQIFQSQQKGDWLAVADSLAYELVHFLRRTFE